MLVSIEPKVDSRGFFARTICRREFAAARLRADFVQASVSFSEHRGTVRGLHFQWPPSAEDKLVRCVAGALHEVLLDLRPGSASYLEHVTITLDAERRDAVFIPAGIAHGYQTLADRTEVLYEMTDFYAPELATGVRWNDPAFGIEWPIAEITISERDDAYPDFDKPAFEAELHRRRAGASDRGH